MIWHGMEMAMAMAYTNAFFDEVVLVAFEFVLQLVRVTIVLLFLLRCPRGVGQVLGILEVGDLMCDGNGLVEVLDVGASSCLSQSESDCILSKHAGALRYQNQSAEHCSTWMKLIVSTRARYGSLSAPYLCSWLCMS
jgi:hypothetical protein